MNKAIVRRMFDTYKAAKKHYRDSIGSAIGELEIQWFHDERRRLMTITVCASIYDDSRAAKFGLNLYDRLCRLRDSHELT